MLRPAMAILALLVSVAVADSNSLRLMSFNIWHGGARGGQPLSQTANVIKLADVAGIQETHHDETDNSKSIAEQLGWNHVQQGDNTAVISRFPVTGLTPSRLGVFIQLPGGPTICLFNVHLMHEPYQPYQLLNIPYGEAPFITTEQEAIEWAVRSRGDEVDRMVAEIESVRRREIPVLVTGDFNEPSHLDWTARSAAAGIHPIKVEYPATKRLMQQGLLDCYRSVHRDEVARPGFTWTPLTRPSDPQDHHDRIDFVLADGRYCRVSQCAVIGEGQPGADVVVSPWPSDHRAVLATVSVATGGN